MKECSVEGLGQVVRGTHLDAADHAGHLVHGRNHDHGQVAQPVVPFDLLEHLVAVHLGHEDVKQDQIEGIMIVRAQQVQRLAAVLGCGDPVPLFLHGAGQQAAVD